MATAASDEERVVEIVPAAPERNPVLEIMVEEELLPLRAKISQLLGTAGPHRAGVATGDYGRRCLVFLETHMRNTDDYYSSDTESVRLVLECIHYVLREVDPSWHALLRRAAQCFHRRKSYSHLLPLYTVIHYYYIESPLRYDHLLLTSSITPQLGEAGALPLVGIDHPANKIFWWLAHQGKRVMRIVGPVGIGKTTLAVEVRNRLRHEPRGGLCYFQCNVMAQMSREGDRKIGLLQDILSQVSEPGATTLLSDHSQAKPKTMQDLVHLVSEHLQDKRYFVIIDDIQHSHDWWSIKGAFPNNNLDSRILITTRSTSTTWGSDDDDLVHELKPLSEVDSEKLLLAKVVGSMDGCLPNNMKLHCDEILRRCDGIPLFIIGMAEWLNKQRLQQLHQQEDEDEEHQRFAMPYLEQVPRLPDRLEQALYSAFNDFPYYSLGRLLCMSMFPSGYKFEKDRLIWKWIHEGLIHSSVRDWDPGNPLLEAEGNSTAEWFFSFLVDMNVITCVSSNCKHKQDEAEDCQWQVNHFLQQFLATKSAEMGFFFTTANLDLLMAALPATGHGNETRSRVPRRLALHHPYPLLPSLLETMDYSQTRSLAVSGAVSWIPLEKFVNLVVLDLEGWENLKDEDLLQVCRSKMIFLNYLNVRNTRVSKLPHEIKELWTLRTLDLSYTQITELPHEINELWNLRILDISHTKISEFPLELFQLTHLEHLDLRGTRIRQLPKQIMHLEDLTRLLVGGEGTINSVETTRLSHCPYNLKTLVTVDFTKHPASFVRALGDLRSLRVLAVTWSFHQSTDRNYCDALLSSIVKWNELESLTIHCGFGCSMEFLGTLEKSQAPWKLKKFKVTAGRFASVPRWIDGLQRLAFVQIIICNKQTKRDDLKILGDLPKLQCLILGLDFIAGQPIVIGNEGFRELQRFSLDCPMPWLTFETGAMPKLTYLQLKFCSAPASQIRVPSCISNLCRLTEVVLCYNAQYINSPSIKMTVDAVTRQVAEHCNPIDLLINGIEQDDLQEADEVIENTIGTSSRTNAGAEDDAQAVSEEAKAAVQCEITEAESRSN